MRRDQTAETYVGILSYKSTNDSHALHSLLFIIRVSQCGVSSKMSVVDILHFLVNHLIKNVLSVVMSWTAFQSSYSHIIWSKSLRILEVE